MGMETVEGVGEPNASVRQKPAEAPVEAELFPTVTSLRAVLS